MRKKRNERINSDEKNLLSEVFFRYIDVFFNESNDLASDVPGGHMF